MLHNMVESKKQATSSELNRKQVTSSELNRSVYTYAGVITCVISSASAMNNRLIGLLG